MSGKKDMMRAERARFQGPQTIDEENRTVSAVFSTENPVRIYDPFSGKMIDEILLASGVRSAKTVSLLDSHDRSSVKNVLGSAEIDPEHGGLVSGLVRFAASASEEFEKVRDGHITDFSVGYRISKEGTQYIKEGESKRIDGREFTGPAAIRTEWELKELSLVAIGADPAAKARGEENIEEKETKKEKDTMEKEKEVKAEEIRKDTDKEEVRTDPLPVVAVEPVDLEAVRAAERQAIAETNKEIRSLCRSFSIDPDQYCDSGKTIEQVRKEVLDVVAAQHKEHTFSHGESEEEKNLRQASDGICIRQGFPVDDDARKQANPFATMTAMEIAKDRLQRAGENLSGLTVDEIAKRAMTSSDFPNIISTTANKMLKVGYNEKQYKWSTFCSVGSAPNFLTQTEVEVSRGGTLTKLTTENPEYPMKYFTDGAQTYSLDTYAGMWRFSWKTTINDQMNIIRDVTAMGQTAARTVEKTVFVFIESNPTMSDTYALFSTQHGNLVASGAGAAPGLATFNAAELAMSNQLDIDGETKLEIMPEYMLAPTAIKGATRQFLTSRLWNDEATIGTPDYSTAGTRNNIWMDRGLNEVYSAHFTNLTGWYFLGPKGETFEVFYLNGRSAPTIDSAVDFKTKDLMTTVDLHFGVRAKDWKAVYFNYGV